MGSADDSEAVDSVVVQSWTGPEGVTAGTQRGAEACFLRHFILKTIFLPRQARDKYRKSGGKTRFLSAGYRMLRSHGYYLDHLEPASKHYEIDPAEWYTNRRRPVRTECACTSLRRFLS